MCEIATVSRAKGSGLAPKKTVGGAVCLEIRHDYDSAQGLNPLRAVFCRTIGAGMAAM